ncbi:hypothetical protein PG993_011869 [Apiospora rasikravindrae]|uniref:Uncharacterized protein n=1 Tax=Apiospora rasikravindrae TaxID=990691 RepID=A0ABR1S0Z9_9PEZI
MGKFHAANCRHKVNRKDIRADHITDQLLSFPVSAVRDAAPESDLGRFRTPTNGSLSQDELKRTQLYDATADHFDALCELTAPRHPDAAGREHGELAQSLYRTTSPVSLLLNKTGVPALGISQDRVDDLAFATLAAARATRERWAEVHGRVRDAREMLSRLQRGNEWILATAEREHASVTTDLATLPFHWTGLYKEPRALANLWGLYRRPRVVSDTKLRHWVDSLEPVRRQADKAGVAMRGIDYPLARLDEAVAELELQVESLRSVSGLGLLRDWDRHEGQIVWRAGAWRQALAQLHGFRLSSLDFWLSRVAALGGWANVAVNHFWLLELAFEPVTNALLVVVTIWLLPSGGRASKCVYVLLSGLVLAIGCRVIVLHSLQMEGVPLQRGDSELILTLRDIARHIASA